MPNTGFWVKNGVLGQKWGFGSKMGFWGGYSQKGVKTAIWGGGYSQIGGISKQYIIGYTLLGFWVTFLSHPFRCTNPERGGLEKIQGKTTGAFLGFLDTPFFEFWPLFDPSSEPFVSFS